MFVKKCCVVSIKNGVRVNKIVVNIANQNHVKLISAQKETKLDILIQMEWRHL